MRVSPTALALVLALGLALAGPAGAAAGIDPAHVEATGAPDTAYLDAVRWGGLQTEIVYLRPGAPLPQRDVAVPEAPGVADPGAQRRVWAIAAGTVLLLVLAFAAWYGRGVSAAFGSARDPLRRAPEPGGASPAVDPPDDAYLAGLAAMPDRRLALILLVARALDQAAAANGLRLGRSQTARDVLRVLPRRWPHLDALRRLVAEAEIVRFGGRELPEERWRACLEQARPLFAAGRA
jgi:hypothetical protein